jgi:hypothetical protein
MGEISAMGSGDDLPNARSHPHYAIGVASTDSLPQPGSKFHIPKNLLKKQRPKSRK